MRVSENECASEQSAVKKATGKKESECERAQVIQVSENERLSLRMSEIE